MTGADPAAMTRRHGPPRLRRRPGGVVLRLSATELEAAASASSAPSRRRRPLPLTQRRRPPPPTRRRRPSPLRRQLRGVGSAIDSEASTSTADSEKRHHSDATPCTRHHSEKRHHSDATPCTRHHWEKRHHSEKRQHSTLGERGPCDAEEVTEGVGWRAPGPPSHAPVPSHPRAPRRPPPTSLLRGCSGHLDGRDSGRAALTTGGTGGAAFHPHSRNHRAVHPRSRNQRVVARKRPRQEAVVSSVRKLQRREISSRRYRAFTLSAAQERFRNTQLQEEFATHDPKERSSLLP